jgi:hypothetical protein
MFEHNYESENLACATGLDFYPAVITQTGWDFVNEGTREKPRWGFVSTQVGATLTIEVDTRAHGTTPLPELSPELRVKLSSQPGMRENRSSSEAHVPLPASYSSGVSPSPLVTTLAAASAPDTAVAAAAVAADDAKTVGMRAEAKEADTTPKATATAAGAVATAAGGVIQMEMGSEAREAGAGAGGLEALPPSGADMGAEGLAPELAKVAGGAATAAAAEHTTEKVNRMLAKQEDCAGDGCIVEAAGQGSGVTRSNRKKHERGKKRSLDSSDSFDLSDRDGLHSIVLDDHAGPAAAVEQTLQEEYAAAATTAIRPRLLLGADGGKQSHPPAADAIGPVSDVGGGDAADMQVWVGYLASYEHMGQARLRCVSGCSCADVDVNGWIKHKSSQTFVARLHTTQHAKCRISITILPYTSSQEHKFKVVSVMVSRKVDYDEKYHAWRKFMLDQLGSGA